MEGWISLHRKISSNPLWLLEPFTRGQAWVDMILLANHKPGYFYVRGNKVAIERGQLGISQENLAMRWKWSRGKVNRFLNDLEIEQQIIQQKNRITTIITISNYSKYQKGDTTENTTNGRQTIQQTDTNNNDNKKNKEYTRDFETKSDSDFLTFWNLYGKKADKAKCEQKWKRLKPEEKTAIFKTLPDYIKSTPDSTYRKNPLTYLNGKCWEDEIPTTSNETHRRASNIPYLN